MKISRFRSFMAWAALVSSAFSFCSASAGDFARARAKLTSAAESDEPGQVVQSIAETTASAEPQPTVEPMLLDPASSPLFETARRSTGGPTLGGPGLASPTSAASVTPTLAPSRPTGPQPTLAPLRPSSPSTHEAADGSAARQTELESHSERRIYHNALRGESASAAQSKTDVAVESTGRRTGQISTESKPLRIEFGASVVNPPTDVAKAAAQAETKPVEQPASIGAATSAADARSAASAAAPAAGRRVATIPSAQRPTTVAPSKSVPAAVAPRITRATDAPPLRTSDPSQPGSPLPALSEREPGEPDHEQKMTIGRKPADKATEELFESKEEVPLTPELLQLKKRVQTALALYYQNWTLNTREHSPWEVMHAIVAYGVDTRLRKSDGETTTAIGHLCYSGVCRNQPILTIRNGRVYGLQGPGVQGHPGQFLAILAQAYLQRDYPLYVGGEQYTLEDLIEAEKLDCQAGTELTFKLISLMHYLPSDATWTNFQGQRWSLDRLVREEIVQPIRGAACGGTHRLMGLSYAVRKREQRGEPIDGIYLEAKKYIDQYHKYTFGLQNPDGSFSTAWFVRREARNDIDRRMQTTGHILEWLCFSLSDEQLRDPRVVKAVHYVTNLLLNEHYTQWEVGHLGHGLHALQIYNERVFGGQVRSFEGLVSRKPLKTVQRPTSVK